MSVSETAPTASTVRALVRGTRTALFVQLFVAVLALGTTAYAALETQRLLKLYDEVKIAVADLESAREGLTRANVAASAGYQAWQAWLRSGQREDLQAALNAFNAALEDAPDDPSMLSARAQVQFALGDAAGAAASIGEAIAQTGEGEAPAFSDVARQVAYHCAANNLDAAQRAIQTAPSGLGAALQSDPALAEARALIAQRCGQAAAELGLAASLYAENVVQPAPEPADAYRVTLIYLHIRDESDRSDAEQVREALRRRGFRVPGIELVAPPRGYSAGVRYYYEAQAEQTGEITGWVAEAGAQQGWGGWTPRQISLAGRYDRLPRDRIEVWLPPRGAPRG